MDVREKIISKIKFFGGHKSDSRVIPFAIVVVRVLDLNRPPKVIGPKTRVIHAR